MTLATSLPGFSEAHAEVKGVRLRYLVAGEGPPLVLVHGLGGSAANWIEIAPALVGTRRVLVPELPGHGGSSPLPAAPTIDPYADRVGLALERAGALPAPVVGHSLGALVALRLAIRRPDAVTGIVLASAAGISSTEARARKALAVTSLVQPGRFIAPHRRLVARSPLLRRLVFGTWAAADAAALSPAAVEGLLVGTLLHTDTTSAARAVVEDDARHDLEHVRCPCLVLWGARDTQVSVADAFEYARRLRAPVRVIADCGHLPIVERPDACLDAIGEFLDGIA